jgi:ATP-binding cassette subfamily F protein 3
MLLVSHDRYLVRTTTDKLLLAAEGKLQDFDGDLTDYEKWLLEFRKQQALSSAPRTDKLEISRKEQRQQDARLREMRKPLLQRVKRLENEIAKLEKEAAVIESALADLSLYEPQNKDKLQNYLLGQARIKKELEKVENDWLQACDERDKSL